MNKNIISPTESIAKNPSSQAIASVIVDEFVGGPAGDRGDGLGLAGPAASSSTPQALESASAATEALASSSLGGWQGSGNEGGTVEGLLSEVARLTEVNTIYIFSSMHSMLAARNQPLSIQ